MRLLMMGTGPFAVPAFESLLDANHEMLALVTKPQPPSRGARRAPAQPMRDAATRRGVPVLDPPDINAREAQELIGGLQPELLVVCDYGQILSAEALSLAPLGGINLHGSLLPEFRGAAPVQWALLEGRQKTGVSVIHMTPRLDSGPCLVQLATEIRPDEDALALEQRLAHLGVAAVHDAIAQLAAWDRESPLGRAQDPALASRAPRLTKSDGELDWTLPAQAIENRVRALKPWPGTYSYWQPNGEPLRVILDRVRAMPTDAAAAGEPGEIVLVEKDRVLVATGDGLLSLESIQPSGKRAMGIAEFLRGHAMRPGQRLGEASS